MQYQGTGDCFEVLKQVIISLCSKVENNKNDDSWHKEVHNFIEQSYTNCDFSLELLAEHMSINYNHMSKIFKERMGNNFVTYIAIMRLENGKELLRKTDLTLEEISTKIGFCNSNVFVKTFKKYYSITPGKYRSQRAGEVGKNL